MPSRKLTVTGCLDKSGSPSVRISVHGISPDSRQEFDAVIDTGFTGFLMMPLLSAFPLGLTLWGTSNYCLADGSTSPKLLGAGTITLEGEEASGVIVLESSPCGLLLGMDFLRKVRRGLVVSAHGVFLVDEDAGESVFRSVSPKHGLSDVGHTVPPPVS